MVSKLKGKKPAEVQQNKPFVLIYGAMGVQKSWQSLGFPAPFYADTENANNKPAYLERLNKAGGIYFGVEEGSQDFEEVINQVKALSTEKHEYKTFVLDSLSKIHNIELTKEMERLGDKDAFGASKKPAINKTRRLINALDRLDMTKIIICHERALWANEKQIGTTFDAFDKLGYELDLILQIVKTGDSHNAFIKKSRLPGFLDSSFPWNYEEFAKRYGKDIIEKDAVQLTLATKEQLQEIKSLLEVWKAPAGQEDKWFAAAKCDSFEEMDSEKLDKIINYVKSKMKGDVK